MGSCKISISKELLFDLLGFEKLDAVILEAESDTVCSCVTLTLYGADKRLPNTKYPFPDCTVESKRVEDKVVSEFKPSGGIYK